MQVDVPHKLQERDGWCVPACLEMILLFLQDTHGDGVKTFSQRRIATICKTNKDGTEFDAYEKLNKKTVDFTPSLEFEACTNQEIENLVEEIGKYLPVIAYIEKDDDGDAFPHAIAVTGIKKSRREVIYNDPMGMKDETMEFGKFRSQWRPDYCTWYVRLDWQKKLIRRK